MAWASALTLPWLNLSGTQANVRYDPWDWVTFKNSQYVSSISEGQEYIYFGTNGGITRYHIFGKFWDLPITRSQGLENDNIKAVYYDFHTNVLWASTGSGLSYSLDRGRRWESVTRETLQLLPNENILQIGSTSDYLWCLTARQVLKVDHLSGFVITPHEVLPEKGLTWGSGDLIGSETVRSLLNDFTATQGWINDAGLFQGPAFEEIPVSTLYVDRFGDVWVGTWGGPVFYGDLQMRLLEPLPHGPAQTNAEILIPAKDGLWIGGGTGSADPSGITFLDLRRGLWDLYRVGYEISFGGTHILCGIAVEQEWWFGTTNGIQIYNPQKDSWSLLPEAQGLPNIRVTKIAYDGKYVYAGTVAGLVRILPTSRTQAPWSLSHRLRNLPIREVHWDGENLWVSTDFSLWKWHLASDGLEQFGAMTDALRGLGPESAGLLSPITAIVSSDSMVYFGDEFGILSYRKSSGEWQRHTGESRLVGFQVLSLFVSPEVQSGGPTIWVGTTRGAIVVNIGDGYIRHFDMRDGLPSNTVRSVIVENGFVWFGTPEGLVRFRWRKRVR